MKKILKISIILLLFCFIRVNGETYRGKIWAGDNIGNIYVKKVRNDGFTHFFTAAYTYLNDKLVYCLEPYFIVKDGYVDFDVSYDNYPPFTEELWNKVKKIAYFGYGYKDLYHDHTADYWFVITQVLMWKEMTSDEEIFFTDRLNGNRIDIYENEINELKSLVDNYEVRPDLYIPHDMYLGKEEIFTDTNNVLKYYQVNVTGPIKIEKDGNNLKVMPTGRGHATIDYLRKENNYNRPFIVYQTSLNQDVMETGDLYEVRGLDDINILSGSIKLMKKYDERQNKYTTKGTKYNLTDKDGKLIKIMTINEKGEDMIDNLPLGKYCLKEVQAAEGFVIDPVSHCLNIDEHFLNIDVTRYNKLITGKLDITKVYAKSDTGVMMPEVDAKFGIYDEDNNLIKEVTTNQNGKINEELYYGKYILRQLTAADGYEKMEDFYFQIKEDGDVISKVIADAKIIKGSITIEKYDDNKEHLEGISFGLYKDNELLETYVTNNKGMVEIDNLELGLYEVKEIKTLDGYELDNKIYKVNLTKENNTFKIGAINKKIIILEVPNTYYD